MLHECVSDFQGLWSCVHLNSHKRILLYNSVLKGDDLMVEQVINIMCNIKNDNTITSYMRYCLKLFLCCFSSFGDH
jgi:hypothetical protein